MKRQHFFILLSLAGGDRHGSAIVRDVLGLTEGELTLWPATLYGALDALAGEGWIEEVSDPEERPATSERLRFYRLTPAGRRSLAAEARRLDGLARAVELRLAEGS